MRTAKLLAGILLSLFPFSTARGTGADRDPSVAAMAGTRLSYRGSPAWAAWANPAVLPFSQPGIAVAAGWQGWMPRYDGGNAFSLAAGGNTGSLGYAVAGSFLSGKTYEILSPSGATEGSFRPCELDIAAGLGVKITDNLSAGAALRIFRNTLAPSSGYNVLGASLLATYRKEAVTFSAGLTDIGTQVDRKSILPAAAAISGAFSADDGVHGFLTGVDARCYFAGGFAVSIGVEYVYDRLVFLRAGGRYCNSTADLPTHASVGTGLRLGGAEWSAAYLFASDTLAGTFIVGATYTF